MKATGRNRAELVDGRDAPKRPVPKMKRSGAARKPAEKEVLETKKYYENLVGNAGDAIIALDREATITVWNIGAERIFGYTRAEALGRTLPALTGNANEPDEIMERHRRALNGEWVGPFETRCYRKDGASLWVSVTASPLWDGDGQVIGVSNILKDTSERKRAEEKLAEMFLRVERSLDDMLSILNMLSVGTAMVSAEGRVTFLSKAGQRLLGKGEMDALGRRWEQVFPLEDKDKAELKGICNRPPELRTKLQVRVEAPRGRRYWMDLHVQDDPRNAQGKIFFLYDMTEVRGLRSMLDEKTHYHNIVGKSKSMKSIYQQIQEVSQVEWTVLIEGETGVGKELVARAMHFSGHRKEKPFIAVNCAGLPDSLLASHLFGHKRGAFTGAVEDQEGLFEAANSGTLFLDEIGDVSTSMQISLLRALEEREITRVGESRPREIDVRIMAATQRDLSEEAEKGNFRPDLLYRLRVMRITIPPLRERREDIPLLVEEFLDQCYAVTGKPVQEASNEAMRKLLEYDWPGNVRELRSAVEFAVTHCRGSAIQAEDLPPEIVRGSYALIMVGGEHQDEKERLQAALEMARGNRTVAARLLGIGRSTLYRRLAHLGIEPTK